ncbi:hypothetical protein K7432_010418 [Basidiobolus ranarum]|uniref:Uncharacterized protein n=1 Tax=Basidiobolus ranarum TaxID=34480 RepID=A0ABR2VVN3_9FUNG
MVRKFFKALPKLSLIPQRDRSTISPVTSPTKHNFTTESHTCWNKISYNYLEERLTSRIAASLLDKNLSKPHSPLSPKFSFATEPLKSPRLAGHASKTALFQRRKHQISVFQKDDVETAKKRLQKTKNFDDMLYNGFYNECNGQYEETLRFSLTPTVARH